jgi:TDG/mug DNA glycosylase family protein
MHSDALRQSEQSESYPFATLPDYLRPGLRLVFVGINPAIYAVQHGHYFARPTNRFWPAFSRSRLSEPVRQGLGKAVLTAKDDAALLDFGIGFTDVVKVPTRKASGLKPADYAQWAPRLMQRLEQYQPKVATFHGVTGFRAFLKYALCEPDTAITLGDQNRCLGTTRLYVVPNPSPANAHFTPADQTQWYNNLADFLDRF